MVFISVGDYENAKRIIELYELQLNNISSKPLSYYLGQIESLLSEYECGKPSLAFYDGTLKHYVDCASDRVLERSLVGRKRPNLLDG
jgi:hypothetical protein